MTALDPTRLATEIPPSVDVPPSDSASPVIDHDDRRLTGRFLVTYVLAAFGMWIAAVTPAGVTLSVRIAEVSPEGFAGLYSLVAGIGAVVSIPASPIFGRLSDISGSRFGRRRPFIVAGSIVSLVGAVVLAYSTSTALLVLGFALVMIGNQIAVSPFWAVVSDKIAPKHQGLLMGLTGAMQSAAALVGVWFAAQVSSSALMLIVPAAVGLVLVVIFALVVPESRTPRTESANLAAVLKSLFIDPRREQGLAYALLSIGLLTAGSSVVGLYVLYYLEVVLGVSQSEALDHVFIYSLVTYAAALATAPLAGYVSDRIGRRGVVYGAAAVFAAVGIAVILATQSIDGFYLGSALMGVSTGIFSGQSMSLVMSTGDVAKAGRNLGLVGVAMSLPFSLVPLVAPALLGIGGGDSNYTALFVAGIILSLLVIPALHLAGRTTRPTR